MVVEQSSLNTIKYCSICDQQRANLTEQCICIKFCFKLEEKCYRHSQNVTVTSVDYNMRRTQVLVWFQKFKSNENPAEDSECSRLFKV